MNWLNKLERKIGRYAIPNLIIWLIGAYAIGFVLNLINPEAVAFLSLYCAWSGLAFGNLDFPTDKYQYFLDADYAPFLLSTGNESGTDLGNIPV